MLRSFIYFLLILVVFTGCKKYLDAKPDRSRFVVSKLSELQGLYDLENSYTIYPISGLLASDDGYFTPENFNSLSQIERSTYVWDAAADLPDDWQNCYQRIFKMNIIIEEFNKLASPDVSLEAKQILGSALFSRAFSHLEIAQLFAPAYDPKNAALANGIPLKLTPDTEARTTRATLEATYKNIINDLTQSTILLPDTGMVKTRPSKCAAYGLLARIYLQMGNYVAAETYADSSLAIYSRLIDYNDVSLVGYNDPATFKLFNPEVIFHSTSWTATFLNTFYADSTLIKSYVPDDLRMPAFFARVSQGIYRFKGGYNGPLAPFYAFTGISTNEIFLIRAESRARNNKSVLAMSDLNMVLSMRWSKGKYIAKSAITAAQALDTILSERRKELCFRPSIRWSDLRRLNRESKYARTLTRKLNGILHQLSPEDPRFSFLIPAGVFAMNNMEQNPR